MNRIQKFKKFSINEENKTNMLQDEIIYELKMLISDWEEEKDRMKEMKTYWEEFDDPGSDPGLQYEQEMKMDEAFERIVAFCKQFSK
jgi:hypothetical protein